jgi:hypothetical protein
MYKNLVTRVACARVAASLRAFAPITALPPFGSFA